MSHGLLNTFNQSVLDQPVLDQLLPYFHSNSHYEIGGSAGSPVATLHCHRLRFCTPDGCAKPQSVSRRELLLFSASITFGQAYIPQQLGIA
ncbi:MAG TPA: hypothetical protein V6C78_28800 [Crinalium sp.]